VQAVKLPFGLLKKPPVDSKRINDLIGRRSIDGCDDEFVEDIAEMGRVVACGDPIVYGYGEILVEVVIRGFPIRRWMVFGLEALSRTKVGVEHVAPFLHGVYGFSMYSQATDVRNLENPGGS